MTEQKRTGRQTSAVKLPDWVVSNMNRYGNCVIDAKLVKRCGLDPVRSALEECCGRAVTMRQFSGYDHDQDTDDPFALKESNYARMAWIAEAHKEAHK